MSEQRKRPVKPIHEQPFGDILASMDHFFTSAVKNLQSPRFIQVFQYETDNEYIVEAELPGVKKDQIQLDIFQNFIKISVKEESSTELKDDKKQISEHVLRFQKAEKVVTLPFAVNESDVKAKLSKGLLVIRIPNRRKRIPIDSEEV